MCGIEAGMQWDGFLCAEISVLKIIQLQAALSAANNSAWRHYAFNVFLQELRV
jgi:hypothetical protein